jgi:uncharacterized membrane protein YGL010W
MMDMLVGYAAAHQHPFNIAVHLIGIPTIMLGVFIPLSWASADFFGLTINLAYVATTFMFAFYWTLDRLFSIVFLLYAVPVAFFSTTKCNETIATYASVAAGAFFGGYVAQFVGHAVEKSIPVILRHPVQANLAAPFFTVVEVFKILGFRESLFDAVQERITQVRANEST